MSALQPSQYAGHSYRIGAATTSASLPPPPPPPAGYQNTGFWGGGPLSAMKDIIDSVPLFSSFWGFPSAVG